MDCHCTLLIGGILNHIILIFHLNQLQNSAEKHKMHILEMVANSKSNINIA